MKNTVAIKDLKKDFKYISEAPKPIYWPTSTDRHDRLVKVSDTDNDLMTVKLGKEQYLSDILLNVEKRDDDNVISFNINDLIEDGKEKGTDFTILGSVLFIDSNNNHVLLSADQYIKIGNYILYMPKDIYLTIDLNTGNCVFKNAAIDSELYVKYLAFFLMTKKDYYDIEEENTKKPLEKEDKYKLNSSIDGYEKLSEEQKKEVDNILDELIYNNTESQVEQFVSDNSSDDNSSRLKIPLNADGTVDIDLFTNQICPKYAEKTIDLSITEFEKELNYIPAITDKDYTNLGFIGFSPKETGNLVSTLRNALINSYEALSDLDEKIELIRENYNKSLSTCCSLISNNVFNTLEYDQSIKNNYTPLAMMKDYENQLEKAKAVFKNSQQTLASFQNISRRDIQKAINDGEFTNKHTFSSLLVFFKTMSRLNYTNSEDINDNYGAYNNYLKYINSKTNELNQYDNYFKDMLSNSLNPNSRNNIYDTSIELFNRFVRIVDLQDLEKKEALKRIVDRVDNRIDYLFEVAYFPINIASYVYSDLIKILSFASDDSDIDFDNIVQKFSNRYEKNGWPAPGNISVENTLLEKALSIRNKLDNPETLESLIGFLKIVRLTVLNEYMTKIISKKNKNNGEVFHTAVIYKLLENIILHIDVIITKKAFVIEDTDKKEKDLTDNELKCVITRVFIRVVSYIIFLATSLRLSNDIADTALSIDKINESDSQTFFSVILNGIIIPIELIDTAMDKGAENDSYLDTVIQEDRLKLLGTEASKIFFSGLKGMYKQNKEEDQPELIESSVSRLFIGRKELMEQAVCFTENVFDIINSFIDDVTIPRDEQESI
jgi:hypothetical protein